MSSNHKGREQEKEKIGERGLQNSQKTIFKTVAVNPYLSIIILNVME